ncbi:MAG: protease inhibitor I42 family protein [Acidobacteriota bacterium]
MYKVNWFVVFFLLLLLPTGRIESVSEDKMMIEEKNKWKNIPAFLINEDGNNKITLKASVTFGLLLRSNLSTGFNWGLKPGPESDIVSYLGVVDHEIEKNDEQKFGSATIEKFVFKSMRSGEIELEFIYCRQWEKDKKPEKKVLIKLIIIDK